MSFSHFGHKAAGVNPLKLHAHTCSRSARDWLKLQPCLHWLVHGLRACSFGLIPTVSTQRVRLLRQDHILPFVSFDSGVLWCTWTLSCTHPKLWPDHTSLFGLSSMQLNLVLTLGLSTEAGVLASSCCALIRLGSEARWLGPSVLVSFSSAH